MFITALTIACPCYQFWDEFIEHPYDIIYLLTTIGLTTGGSSTEHIYTQTIHKTTQW